MLKSPKQFFVIFPLVFAVFVSPGLAWSVNLTVESVSLKSPFQFVMTADRVDKLAGLKVVVVFDKKKLSFVKADKTSATSPFMHIANDKKNGEVVVVMASAKGVSGKGVELLTMEFESTGEGGEVSKPLLTISQCQLMSESLKEIPCVFQETEKGEKSPVL